MKLCVYCGARRGDDPRYLEAAVDLGHRAARAGHTLVYGGGRIGLMGAVADAALEAGGRVIGAIPRALLEREVGHKGLSELIVVETMHQRKLAMAERADAFVALPGGIGTLEELFEMWSWRQLGYHDKPVALLNVAGYYDTLLAFMRTGVTAGFVPQAHHDLLLVRSDAASLLARLEEAAVRSDGADDYTLL